MQVWLVRKGNNIIGIYKDYNDARIIALAEDVERQFPTVHITKHELISSLKRKDN